jgi:hypothetical protein
MIEKYGYAPLEQVREMVEGSDELRANLCVAAHLAHVSYGSRVGDGGRIEPRFRITLASGVPEDVCRRVKLAISAAPTSISKPRAATPTRWSSSTPGAICISCKGAADPTDQKREPRMTRISRIRKQEL